MKLKVRQESSSYPKIAEAHKVLKNTKSTKSSKSSKKALKALKAKTSSLYPRLLLTITQLSEQLA